MLVRNELKIHFLKEQSEFFSEVAEIIFEQWGHKIPGNRIEDTKEKLEGFLNDDRIPFTMICLQEKKLIAFYNVMLFDPPARADLSPWFGSLYVQPCSRGMGIGSKLVQHAVDTVKLLKIKNFYLCTPNKQRMYARLGWFPIDEVDFRGEKVTVMEIIT